MSEDFALSMCLEQAGSFWVWVIRLSSFLSGIAGKQLIQFIQTKARKYNENGCKLEAVICRHFLGISILSVPEAFRYGNNQ